MEDKTHVNFQIETRRFQFYWKIVCRTLTMLAWKKREVTLLENGGRIDNAHQCSYDLCLSYHRLRNAA